MDTFIHSRGNVINTTALGKNMRLSCKSWIFIFPVMQPFPSRHIAQRTSYTHALRGRYTDIYGHFGCHTGKLETVECPLTREWMHTFWHTHLTEPKTSVKKGTANTYSNIDGSQKQLWATKGSHRGNVICPSIFTDFRMKQNKRHVLLERRH